MPHEFKEDTLNDIKARDILNLETFLKKKGRRYKGFGDLKDAMAFQGHQVANIVKHLGLDLQQAHHNPNYDADAVMKEKRIRVENRVYNDDPEDEWRSGIYLYKEDEIAGFVGHPRFDPDLPIDKRKYTVLCSKKI